MQWPTLTLSISTGLIFAGLLGYGAVHGDAVFIAAKVKSESVTFYIDAKNGTDSFNDCRDINRPCRTGDKVR